MFYMERKGRQRVNLTMTISDDYDKVNEYEVTANSAGLTLVLELYVSRVT